MKKSFGRISRVLSVILLIFGLQIVPIGQTVFAATALTINGAQKYQTIDGFGTNVNSASWKNGQLKPAIDKLAEGGTTLWRVIIDNTDWEATNDNNDPDTFNWTYYNSVYSSAKFQDLWNTISYINQKQPTGTVVLNFMGPGPGWMGGDTFTVNETNKKEWVEMIASLVYYAQNTAQVNIGVLSPANEPDWQCTVYHEGMCMSAAVYADVMARLAVKLDAIGLNNLRLMGPDTANIGDGVNDYMPAMMSQPSLMAKVDHFGFHNYEGSTGGADAAIKSSAYPNKDFWIDETSEFKDAFPMVGQNASGILTWDGFDSIYNHAWLRGDTTLPNDAGDGPALLAYNASTGVYTPRKEFYQFEQLFKYVPAGAVRVAATESASGVTVYAFTDPATGRVTIVGNNTGSSVTFTGTLTNITQAVPAFEYYTTTSSANFQRGADVAVSGNTFTVVAPANGIFTLTYAGAPDIIAPTQPTNLRTATAPEASNVSLAWNASTDIGGVKSYTVKRSNGGVVSPNPTILSNNVTDIAFNDTTVLPNTTYTYTVSATDHANNIGQDSAPLTVNTPTAPPVPAFALKSKTTTNQTSAGSSITSSSFTASQGNLIVAFLGSDGPNGSINFNTPTTNGLTWTLRKRANATGSGTAEIWTAVAPSNFTSGTLSAARSSGSYLGSVTIAVFSGADTGATPATGGASGTNSAPSVSLTTTRAGAWVWGVGNDWASVASRTAGSNQTVVDQYLPSGIGAFWVQRQNAPTSSPGVVTINNTTPTNNDKWNLAAIEIIPMPQPTDTQAPTAPTAVTLTAISETQASLSWTASSDDVGVANYEVYRATNGGSATKIATSTGTTYTDTGLTPNTPYQYFIKALDAANNVSAASDILAVTTNADTQAPSAPNDLTANTIGANSLKLTWEVSTDNTGVASYEIWRSTEQQTETFTQVATVPANSTTVTDSGLQPNTLYYYFVRALDAYGNSASSTILQVTTAAPDTTPPSIPTLSASATSFARAHLAWEASTDAGGLKEYTIQRNGQTIGTTSNTSFDDNNLMPGQTYNYTIIATDMSNNVSESAASITLPVVAMSAPANGAALSGTATLSVDNTHGVTGVQFLADGAAIGTEDTSAPYSFAWNTASVANGTHSLSAHVRDAFGNSMTTELVPVTITNATPMIATDVTVSTDWASTSGTAITSPTFSTASTNQLLVALVESSGPGSSGSQTIKTMTGAGLTWTMRQRANTRYGTAEIWTAPATAKLTNVSVTATRNVGGYVGSLTIMSFTGANLTTVGAVAKASAATGLPSVNLTATKVGSLVLGAGNDWDGAAARTVGANQSLVHQYVQTTTGDTFWVQKVNTPTTAIGQVITINNIAPTPSNHQWNLAAIEIIPNN